MLALLLALLFFLIFFIFGGHDCGDRMMFGLRVLQNRLQRRRHRARPTLASLVHVQPVQAGLRRQRGFELFVDSGGRDRVDETQIFQSQQVGAKRVFGRRSTSRVHLAQQFWR